MNKIIFPLKLQMKRPEVKNLHEALALIGYQIEADEKTNQRFGASTRQAVLGFQKEHHLESTGLMDEPTAQALNAALEELGAFNAEPLTFQVEGKVASRVSAGVGKLRVEIVDKTVGKDIRLTEVFTDESGAYQVSFTDADLRRRGKAQPDLQARAYADKTFLAASDVRYNASNRETLNVLLDDKLVSALQSEHKTLTDAISNHFKGNLGALQETDDQQDITYLANKTGWDARAVALVALADQFSTKTMDKGRPQIEPALFYALFRAGLPANEATLYNTDPATAEAIWNQGIAQGVIPSELKESLPQAKQNFQKLAARRALDTPALVGVSSLKDMLSVSELNNEQQRQFAEIYTQYRGNQPRFWEEVRRIFGEEGEKIERRLKLDGQLAYLTLNNAPLISKLHNTSGNKEGLSDTINLVEGGYHDAENWQGLIGDVPIPPEIPGDNEAEKRSRYAELLAAQVRLSFPTAVVAQMVKNNETTLANTKLKGKVQNFLTDHQGEFEISMQPVAQYIARKELRIAPDVVREIARIQRVYNITPSNVAMNALLSKGVDSAYAVVRYDRDEFVQTFKNEVGGEINARLIHARAQQVHNTALNIAVSYLTARNASGIGGYCPAQILTPVGPTSPAANGTDVIAYPTLEGLFGGMDYCDCEHCRSILSPAAYLVDLLLFLYREPQAWDIFKVNWNNLNPDQTIHLSPLDVLLSRRPDIQHLPLTCENTNIALPYIDLVNETLEYYVINNLRLNGYKGHTTDSVVTSEELLANPQFVSDTAYETLAGKPPDNPPLLPPTPSLPFHQPLENLRRYFNKFEAPLPEVMEALRRNDDLERPNSVMEAEYGWRDILMEELCLSRSEYRLLTDHTLTLQELYGYPATTPIENLRKDISNAKTFTRMVGISYVDIIEILKTRFVNPNSTLIPKLERLGVPFSTLQKFKLGEISDAQFDEALAPHLDPSQYGNSIKDWVKNDTNYANIMSLIMLTNPTGSDDVCSFDKLECRYIDPAKLNSWISDFEFVRLLRFIRLWKKLGWTIEQTDKAITALYPAEQIPNDTDYADNMQKLENGFLTLLPRLGVIKRVMEALNLKPNKDLLPLLACFASIDTHGDGSLYRQMFLSPALKQDAVFADDGYGNFLTDNTQTLVGHAETLRAAFSLSDEEFSLIVAAIASQATPPLRSDHIPLTLDNISKVYRRGWLARKLKLSIREFLLLTQFTGIDPFATPDPADPPVMRFTELVNLLRAALLKPTEALYLIWNQDISGRSSPDDSEISGFARTLRSTLTTIESEFSLADDPDGQIARARMTLVYGADAADLFFGLLDNSLVTSVPYSRGQITLVTSVAYSHTQATLEQSIIDAAPRLIAYDDTNHLLSFAGAMTTSIRDALKAAAQAPLSTQEAIDAFNVAIYKLYEENQKVIKANLEQPIVDAAPGLITYDDLRKLLSFAGVLSTATCNALTTAAGVTTEFVAAVGSLYAENQKVVGPFFVRFPELRSRYEAYVFFMQLRSVVNYTHPHTELEDDIIAIAPAHIDYDDHCKRLSFTGVLSADTCQALKNAAAAIAETTLTSQQKSDFNAAVDLLYADNNGKIVAFFTLNSELVPFRESYLAANDSSAQQRSVFLQSFLPELKRRRKRQQALQVISAVAKVNGAFASAVLNDATVLHAAGDNVLLPALDDLTALETTGLSAKFFFSDTIPDPVPDPANLTRTAEANLAYTATGSNKLPANPSGAISGIWSGYLEAPENGFYNLRIEVDTADPVDTETSVTLNLNGALVTLDRNANTWTNHDSIELHTGKLYAISLKVEKVKDTLIVSWQTTGRGWETIPAQYLYSAILTDHLRQVYVRFLKTVSLATALKMTANEIAYLASNDDYNISNEGWLNSLPFSDSPDASTSVKLLDVLAALLDFARVKADLSPGDERLLTILKDPATVTQNGDSLLLTLTRWEPGSLDALLIRFDKVIGNNADRSALKDLYTFCRVYDAYSWMKKLGINASALINAATNEPNAVTVRNLQSALRARYDRSDWLNILKPINDEMRGLQRDALVAYILHQMRSNDLTKHIDTPDKLFEYFLMDVQMEPCMQTSRIRHALSSIQLFIERCLMNLETRVAPSSINARQWEWMSRYRVWEANRKVFLFAENWLEPELRDDQSPFFKETMSELLQSDITEDTAATALLNYLSKLEEVAKLEPCGIHYEEGDPIETEDDIAHVVARTAGASRKYYYRRREYGYWTAWEQIKLDIEDNPVLPVVWKGRLFLFWLRILKQPTLDTPRTNNGTPVDTLNASTTIKTPAPKLTVQAVLCWSEYYNGKWQPTKTSDVNEPTTLGRYAPSGSGTFDRSKLRFWVYSEGDGLRVRIAQGNLPSSFLLYNTHSVPLPQEIAPLDPTAYQDAICRPYRVVALSNGSLDIRYGKIVDQFKVPALTVLKNRTVDQFKVPVLTVLKNAITGRVIEPWNAPLDRWGIPFFYEDSHHVFYVTTAERIVKIPMWQEYIPTIIPQKPGPAVPALVQPALPLDPRPRPIPETYSPSMQRPDLGVADQSSMERFISEDTYIRRGIGSAGTIHFGDKEIGPAGGLISSK